MSVGTGRVYSLARNKGATARQAAEQSWRSGAGRRASARSLLARVGHMASKQQGHLGDGVRWAKS